MNKKITAIVTVSVLSLSLLLSACAKKPAAESPSPSVSPSPVTASAAPSTETVKYPLVVEAESVVKADLNGDGKDDEVTFKPSEDRSFIGHLTINGTDYAKSLYDNGLNIDSLEPKYYCITNIDTSDKMLEIAIMDYGLSDDCITDFFRYDGTNLKYLGNISGLIWKVQSDKSDLTFNGDGTISSYVRLSVMQTWFAKADWKLAQSGGFEVVPAKLYYPTSDSGCNVTALYDVYLYADSSDSSEKTVLKAGATLTLLATDNKQWVLAETSDGKQCWIRLDSEYGQMVETVNGYDYSDKVFSGLCIAD